MDKPEALQLLVEATESHLEHEWYWLAKEYFDTDDDEYRSHAKYLHKLQEALNIVCKEETYCHTESITSTSPLWP